MSNAAEDDLQNSTLTKKEGGIDDLKPNEDFNNTTLPSPSRLALSPKRGSTTLSKTSSFEALDPHDPTLNKLAVNMFQKTASYLEEELSVTQEEYKLLQNMNRITATKYADMAHLTSSVGSALSILNEKYQGLQPYLDQIDQIEDSVAQLEQAAYKLDAYTKRLEAKFKSLEKR